MTKRTDKDRPITEATLESGEVAVDILTRGEILAEIPFIGTAIKWCKAVDSIRERAFAVKLGRFLEHLEEISTDEKLRLKLKMTSGTAEAEKAGEVLFFVLERMTDLEKPSLLAKVFLAYIDGVISCEELQRLAQAIDSAFFGDLKQLLALEENPDESMEPWMFNLVASGLVHLRGSGMIGDMGRLYCVVSPLGKCLRKTYSSQQGRGWEQA